MAEYKIKWAEQKTSSTGKTYSVLDLEGVEGKVSIWPDHPEYKELMNGGVVKGEIVKKGNFTNLAPENAVAGQFRGNKGAFKSQQVKEAQERQAVYVKEAQENRGQGVRVSATMRDAVLIATTLAQGQIQDEGVLKGKILELRKWLWDHWEDPEEYPPF